MTHKIRIKGKNIRVIINFPQHVLRLQHLQHVAASAVKTILPPKVPTTNAKATKTGKRMKQAEIMSHYIAKGSLDVAISLKISHKIPP